MTLQDPTAPAAASPVFPRDSTAPHQIGEFSIERRLGAGGMGVVYLARQTSLNRLVALKVLGARLTRPEDIVRFRREAQAAARLNHPAIASIYYIGQDASICYMAMEYIDGASLREAMRPLQQTDSVYSRLDEALFASDQTASIPAAVRFGAANEITLDFVAPDRSPSDAALTDAARRAISQPEYWRRCCERVRDVARALHYAHEQSVVHRDMKPENLMLDRRGQIHIIEFGVARLLEDSSLTYTGQRVGTPLYMSPEQVTGRVQLDGRTDIYSLGMVFYELVSLRPPLTAPTREAVLRKIVTKAMVPVRWLNPAIPVQLEAIVHIATSKDPDHRYGTAEEMANGLQNLLDGKPVKARAYRFRLDESEIAASRPTGVTFAALVLVLLAAPNLLFFSTTKPVRICRLSRRIGWSRHCRGDPHALKHRSGANGVARGASPYLWD